MATASLQSAVVGVLLIYSKINAFDIPRPISFHNCMSMAISGARGPQGNVLYSNAIDGDDFIGADTTDDLDEFLNELDEQPVDSSQATTSIEVSNKNDALSQKESFHFIQGQQAVGIGGTSGFTYDVNALKRNLVQESVRGCKQELLTLLGDGREYSNAKAVKTQRPMPVPKSRRDRDGLIEERLASLVQANPVSTTTDSNLLDGDWTFAFATKSASRILDTSRFLLSKTKRKLDINKSSQTKPKDNEAIVRGGPWRFKSGKTENPFRSSTRQILLENLRQDEDAHIIDKTSVLGGLYTIKQRYGVFGLTRTALDLDLVGRETRFFGLTFGRKSQDDFRGTKYGAPLEVQVLYLDTDLCVCTTGLGFEGPLHVYTKSDLWVTGGAKRKLRLIAKTASWVSTLESPFHIRQKISKLFTPKKPKLSSPDSVLKAINIGELNINEDGSTKEDPSWDGEDDPFYHLTPGERIEVLKTMSLQDIYEAALKKKSQNKKEKQRWTAREKRFKKPDL